MSDDFTKMVVGVIEKAHGELSEDGISLITENVEKAAEFIVLYDKRLEDAEFDDLMKIVGEWQKAAPSHA